MSAVPSSVQWATHLPTKALMLLLSLGSKIILCTLLFPHFQSCMPRTSVLAAGKKRRFKQPHFSVGEHEAAKEAGPCSLECPHPSFALCYKAI